MQRWTRKARDLIPSDLRVKCAGSNEEYAKLYLQTQIYGKALEVARKGNFNLETCDIVMKYLQKAERKVDEVMQKLAEEANLAHKENNEDKMHPMRNEALSESEGISANMFGASGSCAGMSDEEVMNIRAPPRPKKQGKAREKRFLSFLDKVDKKNRSKVQKKQIGMKIKKAVARVTSQNNKKPRKSKVMATSTKITSHCKICRKPGHNSSRCPNATDCPPERM